MEENKKHNLKAIRWNPEDWDMVGKMAAAIGISRSQFIKRVVLGEAAALAGGGITHYVGASTHNGGANTFLDAEQPQKRFPEEIGAGVPTVGDTTKKRKRA